MHFSHTRQPCLPATDCCNQLRHHSLLQASSVLIGDNVQGIDQGGVTKEFFQLVTRALFNEVCLVFGCASTACWHQHARPAAGCISARILLFEQSTRIVLFWEENMHPHATCCRMPALHLSSLPRQSRLRSCAPGLLNLHCSDADAMLQAYGMFVWNAQTRTFWFNHLSLDSEQDFMLTGMVLGLAIYNSVILDAHFPLVAYKKLLGKQPDFQVCASQKWVFLHSHSCTITLACLAWCERSVARGCHSPA